MKYPEKVLLKLPAGTLEEIDGVCDNRSDWLRGLITAALGGGARIEAGHVPGPLILPDPPKKNSIKGSGLGTRLPADAQVVLEAVRSKRRGSQEHERSFGWLGLRYLNAEKTLLDAGAVAVVDGCLVALTVGGEQE